MLNVNYPAKNFGFRDFFDRFVGKEAGGCPACGSYSYTVLRWGGVVVGCKCTKCLTIFREKG